jgi:hypothetical protein
MYLPGVIVCESLDDMVAEMASGHAIVVIDEAAQWFGAHSSQRNAKFMHLFREHGKDGHTLFIIAHSYADLDVTIRERTCETITRVKRLFGPNQWEEPSFLEELIGWWAIAYKYDAAHYDTVTKRIRLGAPQFIRLDAYHGMFDTLAKVGWQGQKAERRGVGLASLKAMQTGPKAAPPRGRGAAPPTKATQPRFRRMQEDPWGVCPSYGQTIEDALDRLYVERPKQREHA